LLIASPKSLSMDFIKKKKLSVPKISHLDANEKIVQQQMALRKPVAFQRLSLGINVEDQYIKIKYDNDDGLIYRKDSDYNDLNINRLKVSDL
ncbi:hypothetical protein COBT_003786, partial [Conglomerata obtusa]